MRKKAGQRAWVIGASVSEPHTCRVNAIFSVFLSVPYVVPKLNINSRITKNSHVRKIATPTTLFTLCVLLNCMLPSLCNSTYSYVLAHARPTMRCIHLVLLRAKKSWTKSLGTRLCSCVCPCVRVKNGNGSRMRALPDELSPVTREVHGRMARQASQNYGADFNFRKS